MRLQLMFKLESKYSWTVGLFPPSRGKVRMERLEGTWLGGAPCNVVLLGTSWKDLAGW